MTLAQWEARLREHFSELRRQRAAAHGDKPLFALEHGLTPAEVTQLSLAVRSDVAQAPPDKQAPLVWVAYAAELGYQYSGDEYWQSFEDQTPGWSIFGDRQWLRACYQTFQKTFGAAEPSGPWAKHFSIICWPITHAILPRDLQRQLAQIVFESRHLFSADLFETPARLGEFIRARSWNASSRFQQLVEDPQLVGQIAAALLLQGKFGTSGLIDALTLQRIGSDLDSEQRSREWLRRARGVAEERAQIRGFASSSWRPPTRDQETTPSSLERARAEISALGIEPRLVLRRKADDRSWEVVLEVPDLSHLLSRFPETREVLTGSRCTVAGSAGRPLARASFLHGVQPVRLTRWPNGSEVLLAFDVRSPQLEYLLRTECLLRPGPLWLFRIASDGVAYELRSQLVRPGHRYIAVRAGTPFVGRHLEAVHVECSGVDAALLHVPPTADHDWEQDLGRMGLRLAKTLEAWPAGLDALAWDGEGHGEWFVSERPCIAIRVDHHLESLFAVLDDHRIKVDLSTAKTGEPVFVQLPTLAVGRHTMRLSARATASGETEPLGELEILMRVRETPARLGVSRHGPLVVDIDPSTPSLEQFWDGRVDVSVRGPGGRSLKCHITLGGKGAVGSAKTLPPLGLPITPERWRDHFDTHVRRSDLWRAYDTADRGVIRFDGDDLGTFEIRCERAFTPLRWAVRRTGQQRSARVIDDSGDPEPLESVRLAFETPTVEESLGEAALHDVAAAGGLYVARRAGSSAAVILSPSSHGRGFDALRCSPRIATRGRSVEDIVVLTRLTSTWAAARAPGDAIGLVWRRDVIRALTREIFRIVGGDAWAVAESAASASDDAFEALKRSVSKKQEERNIAAGLFRVHEELAQKPLNQRVMRLADSVTTFRLLPQVSGEAIAASAGTVLRGRPAPDQGALWLSELALRLASAAPGLEQWSGPAFKRGLTSLTEMPTVARAARFLVLAIDRRMSARTSLESAYASWEWQ